MITKRQSLSARVELERAFRPFSCSFRHDPFSVRLHVYELETGQTHLIVSGIPISQVATSKGIAKLVYELRDELEGFALIRA